MERDVHLAIEHAVDIARGKRRRLASVSLAGAATSEAVHALAQAALRRLGATCDEVRFTQGEGPLRLVSLDLHD